MSGKTAMPVRTGTRREKKSGFFGGSLRFEGVVFSHPAGERSFLTIWEILIFGEGGKRRANLLAADSS